MQNIDWKLIVSVYAALVSTFVALWRIFEFIDERKGKIEIRIITGTKSPITKFWDEFDKETIVPVLLTNVGRKARHIKSPYLQVRPRMTIKEHTEMMLTEARKPFAPTLLQPGEEMKIHLPMWILVKFHQAGAKKVRIEVMDTHRKLHKSKWRDL